MSKLVKYYGLLEPEIECVIMEREKETIPQEMNTIMTKDPQKDSLMSNLINIFLDVLSAEEYVSERKQLLDLIKEKGWSYEEKSFPLEEQAARKQALLSHLKEVDNLSDLKEIQLHQKSPDLNYYILTFETICNNGQVMKHKEAYKVMTEEECIKQLAEWYEHDITVLYFGGKEISDITGIPIQLLEPLGLLTNYDEDSQCGDGTQFLYDLLKKLGKLEELAANAKANNFAYLGEEHYSYLVGNYYVMAADPELDSELLD